MAERSDQSRARSDEEWREELSEEEYRVLRECGTETAGTSDLLHVDGEGVFRCAGCGQTLFSTDEKFESGTGWPSFFEPAAEGAVETREDRSHGMVRTEVVCSDCGGHLGHVFDDGPEPTGKRYCINGVALEFDGE
ncbi:MAG: peptide-methionine (R)-S-oxide reductase MsrB [Halobacteriales archaeon]